MNHWPLESLQRTPPPPSSQWEASLLPPGPAHLPRKSPPPGSTAATKQPMKSLSTSTRPLSAANEKLPHCYTAATQQLLKSISIATRPLSAANEKPPDCHTAARSSQWRAFPLPHSMAASLDSAANEDSPNFHTAQVRSQWKASRCHCASTVAGECVWLAWSRGILIIDKFDFEWGYIMCSDRSKLDMKEVKWYFWTNIKNTYGLSRRVSVLVTREPCRKRFHKDIFVCVCMYLYIEYWWINILGYEY